MITIGPFTIERAALKFNDGTTMLDGIRLTYNGPRRQLYLRLIVAGHSVIVDRDVGCGCGS